jgi:hypothetical protein
MIVERGAREHFAEVPAFLEDGSNVFAAQDMDVEDWRA